MVLAPHDVRDGGVEIVDRDGEVVEHRAVRPGDHGVVEMEVLEARVPTDHVVDDRRPLVAHAQAHRAVGLALAAEAALGAVLLLVGLHVLGGGVRAVGAAGPEQRLEHLAVALGALGLQDRTLVPVELQPRERIEDLLDVLGRRALAVGVLDAQHELAAGVPGEQPVEQRRARAADVQRSRRRWREANPHRMGRMLVAASSSPQVQAHARRAPASMAC
jgi:hypothetical protein